MTKVVSMARTSEYWVIRAQKHRFAGRYGEAMALLAKARDQFGLDEAIEWEMALTYDEMDCEEEAARSYLRVARLKGTYCAQAWFNLALSSAQRADLTRAVSYFEQFESSDRQGVSPELASLLKRQMGDVMQTPVTKNQKQRAKKLERRAVDRLQEGKVHAARRTLLHALDRCENAQRLTLLACCEMLLGRLEDALEHAHKAHALAPARIQTICVLIDLLYTMGRMEEAKRMLHIAVLRAQNADDLFNIAVESAKHGEERMTLRLTKTLLHREPYSTKGMLLRGCALLNLGRMDEAKRQFAQLCVLLPENTVCPYAYALAREEKKPSERLTLGLDVPREEAVNRVMRMMSALYAGGKDMDDAQSRELCRLCAWAFRSSIAGKNAAIVGVLLLNMIKTEEAHQTMLDALTDPQVSDALKYMLMQALTADGAFVPYNVDIGGKLVKLAASGTAKTQEGGEAAQEIVQAAADALMPDFPQAPRVLLPLYIAYLERYGLPQAREKIACAAALEYLFHELKKHRVKLSTIARRNGVSVRLCRVMVRRMTKAIRETVQNNERKHVQ